MKSIIFILLLFPLFLNAQIKIDQAGDFWELKVQQALDKVKSVDSAYYNLIAESCDKISFWNGDFSTNEGGGISTKGTIVVSRKDILMGDVNNICAILVHEAVHLRIQMLGAKYTENEEEIICYSTERNFLLKVPDVGRYLIDHTEKQILIRRN